jgi:hypothetical protein
MEADCVDWGIGIMRIWGSYRFVNGGLNTLNRTNTILLKLNLDGPPPPYTTFFVFFGVLMFEGTLG